MVLWAAQVASAPGAARAYSSFADYVRPIHEGGGGGRLFTGTPADGYGCKVCHRGAQGAPLHIEGLPANGYQPGHSYPITLRWPATTPHVALMAELTDAAGRPVGSTALAPYASWEIGERCETAGGPPAADVCRVDAAGGQCCRDLDPTRDSCSFPNERSVLWVLDCGSRHARMVWTAPPASAGDIWFSTEMVTSNLQFDAIGDGVTSMRTLIRPAGVAKELRSAVGGCGAVPGMRTRRSALLGLTLGPLLWALWRARRTNRDEPDGHRT
jgi:hypothetical protein